VKISVNLRENKKNLPQIFADRIHADDRRLEDYYRLSFKKNLCKSAGKSAVICGKIKKSPADDRRLE
jgi:hypothetical protein